MSRLENGWIKVGKMEIDHSSQDEQVLSAMLDLVPWLVDFKNYHVSDIILDDMSFQVMKKISLLCE